MSTSLNHVAHYMAAQKIGTTELARRLGVTVGYASLLKGGQRPVTNRIARRLAELTGKPWWKFMPEQSAA